MIEKIGYYIGVAIAILFFAVLTCTILNIKEAQSNDGLSGVTTVYHDTEEIIYNESTSFGVKTTATVEESDCLKCLKRFSLDSCKAIHLCLDVSNNN